MADTVPEQELKIRQWPFCCNLVCDFPPLPSKITQVALSVIKPACCNISVKELSSGATVLQIKITKPLPSFCLWCTAFAALTREVQD